MEMTSYTIKKYPKNSSSLVGLNFQMSRVPVTLLDAAQAVQGALLVNKRINLYQRIDSGRWIFQVMKEVPEQYKERVGDQYLSYLFQDTYELKGAERFIEDVTVPLIQKGHHIYKKVYEESVSLTSKKYLFTKVTTLLLQQEDFREQAQALSMEEIN